MALIDNERDALVLRVVFDGPPVAGKTATVRALARMLGGEVKTPESAGERTLWYDWMSYMGGRFEGRSILCQAVTVPGQAGLARRRHAILASADVVVCVADTTDAALDRSLRWYEDLLGLLSTSTPPVPVVVQANKRDHHRAVPLDVVAARVAAAGGADGVLTETNAMTGEGVRQTFVFAVRLALRRVGEVIAAEQLAEGTAETAAELLGALRALESDDISLVRHPALRQDPVPRLEPGPPLPVLALSEPAVSEPAVSEPQGSEPAVPEPEPRPQAVPRPHPAPPPQRAPVAPARRRLERMNLRGLLALLRNDPPGEARGRAS